AHGVTGQKDIRGERDQFRRVLALAIDIVLAPAGVDPHIAVAPAQLLQDLPERRYAGLTLLIVRMFISTPIRRICSGCCARAASGHAAVPARIAMKWRRLRAGMGYPVQPVSSTI